MSAMSFEFFMWRLSYGDVFSIANIIKSGERLRPHYRGPVVRSFSISSLRTRTGEGRERAKARGVVLGRKPKLSLHQRREALARREAGEVLTDIARTYNVSHSTI